MENSSAEFTLNRRNFLIGLAGLMALRLPLEAEAQSAQAPFSFAFVSDVHLVSGVPDQYKLLQESQLFFQDIVKSLNKEKLDFVLFGGDQVEGPGKDDANWSLFLDIAQGLSAPWTFVLGEHDVSGQEPVDRMRTYGVDWKGRGIDNSKSYWSWNPVGGVHVVGLDTAQANTPAGVLNADQLEWLQKDLAANASAFTIVLSHHPLLPPAPFDGGPPWDQYVIPEGAGAREVLSGHPSVKLALSGHVHVSKIQREGSIWYVSGPSLDVYPCGYRVFHVTPGNIEVETRQVSFPALVKKARQMLATSTIAHDFNPAKPDQFAAQAEGQKGDQIANLSLDATAPVAAATKKRKKRNGEKRG